MIEQLDLLTMETEELYNLAMDHLEIDKVGSIAKHMKVFHDLAHEQFNWPRSKCEHMRRMFMMLVILGQRSSNPKGDDELTLPTGGLFDKTSLEYVLSGQTDAPNDKFDEFTQFERRAMDEICRHAFNERISNAMENHENIDEKTMFSAGMDALVMFLSMQKHYSASQRLGEIIVFDDD